MRDKDYDLVYIVKHSDYNPDLRYSLRSVEKFCTYRKIWMTGWTPHWIKNVVSVRVNQGINKWSNSTNNLIEACKCPELSENFILMNDDFFATHPIESWRTTCNHIRGTLLEYAEYSAKYLEPSKYRFAFAKTHNFLEAAHAKKFNDWELHIPTIINKYKFLEMMQRADVVSYRAQNPVFLKRSVYHNLYGQRGTPVVMPDVKLKESEDLDPLRLLYDWVSVLDGVSDNEEKYPRLHAWLQSNFKQKSSYEKW